MATLKQIRTKLLNARYVDPESWHLGLAPCVVSWRMLEFLENLWAKTHGNIFWTLPFFFVFKRMDLKAKFAPEVYRFFAVDVFGRKEL